MSEVTKEQRDKVLEIMFWIFLISLLGGLTAFGRLPGFFAGIGFIIFFVLIKNKKTATK